MNLCEKRLMTDFKNLVSSQPKSFMASPFKDNIKRWAAVILGPEDTAWTGAALCLSIDFSADYPTRPPTFKFLTKIFHPNVYATGDICLDILKEKWSPAYDVCSVLVSIQNLLTDPNPQSPANAEAANLYVRDRNGFDLRVQKVAEESWDQIEPGPYVELLDKLLGDKPE
ncbi:Ubiquitin-conjugating_enzyme E2 [Hexamita inflata]|uniref:Ubiquitin-conjugating enzyme E2 n=1 Tax=Hexamita inflata TaxID=28002 RepID=A0AA86RP05_9EUKA|nr:Ubiquitin-conjugating enzyme E2 [Hexamita inflata]CAI9978293.1 Ubiquitin-conjugating enzyme E2 [Hexamita inflata]